MRPVRWGAGTEELCGGRPRESSGLPRVRWPWAHNGSHHLDSRMGETKTLEPRNPKFKRCLRLLSHVTQEQRPNTSEPQSAPLVKGGRMRMCQELW